MLSPYSYIHGLVDISNVPTYYNKGYDGEVGDIGSGEQVCAVLMDMDGT